MQIPDYLTQEDLLQIEEQGLSLKEIEKQIKRLTNGFPYLKVLRSATVGEGITRLSKEEQVKYLEEWSKAQSSSGKKIIKFIPASGAASRMFKELYEVLSNSQECSMEELPDSVKSVLDQIHLFAFFDALNSVCLKNEFKTCTRMLAQGEYRKVISYLIEEKGLNYGNLPKALLLFHKYKDGNRTAAEEHLAEGAMYAKDLQGDVHLHFTLSPEHIAPFNELMSQKKSLLEERYSVNYNISYSIQKKETDTIAVDMNNQPLRDPKTGRLVFRPGGHGALIQNLNEIDADIIFIKNIDNVVPDHHKCETVIYKKVLGGFLVFLRNKVYRLMESLTKGRISRDTIEQARDLLYRYFSVDINIEGLHPEDAVRIIREKLNRPIRICGMVKNEGEPGGGPYIIEHEDGTTSLQILEGTQIDTSTEEGQKLLLSGTHFNPVDIVCSIKDYQGKFFDLTAFIDENTGFIAEKSKGGERLKALELPGLWNGAMAGWNTAFVEVPAETFNPVKTINDLLRDSHR